MTTVLTSIGNTGETGNKSLWIGWTTILLLGIAIIMLYEQKVNWKQYVSSIQPEELQKYETWMSLVWYMSFFFLGGTLIIFVYNRR